MQDAEVTESLDGTSQNYIQFRIFNLGWFSISFVVSPISWTIVQFRVRFDRWIEEVKTHFLQA